MMRMIDWLEVGRFEWLGILASEFAAGKSEGFEVRIGRGL